MPRCSNEVQIGNMVDQLRISGGFCKEQRRRHIECLLRHSAKLKRELDEMKKPDMVGKDKLEQEDDNEDSKSENNQLDDN